MATQSTAQLRLQRVQALQKATKDYVDKETKRLKNEVSVMQAILKGRTGGKGIQDLNTQVASAVAYNDMAAYLAPKKT